jgi:carboxyl-terminal processing protease
VEYNEDNYPEYYNKLLDRGLIFRFAFTYTDTHRQELSKYITFSDFEKEFNISARLFNNFIDYAVEKGVEKDADGIRESEERIKTLMKAFIGRNLFDDDGFYPIYHRIDETFQEAINFLTSNP